MASSFKYLSNNDRVVSTTNLTEADTLAKGTGWSASLLPSAGTATFAKITSGSSNVNVFDVAVGRSSQTTGGSDLSKEQNLYNQLAKVLLGLDENNNILKFNLDANENVNDNELHNAIFVNFSRSQFKDKIAKGTFSLLVNVSGASNVYLADVSGTVGPTVRECETGEYGLLLVSASSPSGLAASANLTGGLVFYEAGIAVVSPYVFSQYNASNPNPSSSNDYFNSNVKGLLSSAPVSNYSASTVGNAFVSSSLSSSVYGFYNNLLTASFQSITELNSTIYFCRAFNNEFNYSSNPTYLSSSQIVVKEGDPMNQPAAYITSVGLYDDNNQLLAVAKLSEPIKKTPDTELIARVRLDF